MRFYTLAEKKPVEGQKILIKCFYGFERNYFFGIWDFDEYSKHRFGVFIPALSDDENIEYIFEDIIGWMPIEDLDEIKVGE